MKVKDLKKIIENIDDEFDVYVKDSRFGLDKPDFGIITVKKHDGVVYELHGDFKVGRKDNAISL